MDCDDEGLKMFHPDQWLPKIACERCATYKENFRKTENRIVAVCQLLRGCRLNMNGPKRLELESRFREKLDDLTKRLCGFVCNYFRVTNVWDDAVPQMIFEKPESASVYIGVYLRGIADNSEAN